jgi:hypothetical protein
MNRRVPRIRSFGSYGPTCDTPQLTHLEKLANRRVGTCRTSPAKCRRNFRRRECGFGGGSGFDVIPEGVGEVGAVFVGDAAGGALDLFDEAVEVVAGAGDGDDAEGGGLPGDGFVELGDADVEGLAELVLKGADDLAAVFEGVGVLDAEFEGELGDRHGATG